jgi:hypothetical protein
MEREHRDGSLQPHMLSAWELDQVEREIVALSSYENANIVTWRNVEGSLASRFQVCGARALFWFWLWLAVICVGAAGAAILQILGPPEPLTAVSTLATNPVPPPTASDLPSLPPSNSASAVSSIRPPSTPPAPGPSTAAGLFGPALESPSPASLITQSPFAPIPTAVLDALLRRGNAMVAMGNISAARLLFERAAAAGSGRAATAAGKMYDPNFLANMHVVGMEPDSARAGAWYLKAITSGDHEAEDWLRKLKHPRSK